MQQFLLEQLFHPTLWLFLKRFHQTNLDQDNKEHLKLNLTNHTNHYQAMDYHQYNFVVHQDYFETQYVQTKHPDHIQLHQLLYLSHIVESYPVLIDYHFPEKDLPVVGVCLIDKRLYSEESHLVDY